MSETSTQRRGCIRISADMQEHLGNPTTPQAWHGALLLPDRYTIERIEHPVNSKWDTFELWVLSEDIPDVDSPHTQCDVIPVYQQQSLDEDVTIRTVFLSRIDFSYWDGEHWQTIQGKEEVNPPSRTFVVKPYESEKKADVVLLSESENGATVTCGEGWSLASGRPGMGIKISGRYDDGYSDNAVLMPDEALALLAWLQQEKPTLERLAKEQGQ